MRAVITNPQTTKVINSFICLVFFLLASPLLISGNTWAQASGGKKDQQNPMLEAEVLYDLDLQKKHAQGIQNQTSSKEEKSISGIELLLDEMTLKAPEPYEEFHNIELTPEQLEVYESLIRSIRCPVCEGQSIAESNSHVALDLRRFIRTQLHQGTSTESIRQTLQERYGYYISFRPPTNRATSALWLVPLLVLVLAGVFLFRKRAKQQRPPIKP